MAHNISMKCKDKKIQPPSSSKCEKVLSMLKRYVESEFLRAILAPLKNHYRDGVMLIFNGQDPKRYEMIFLLVSNLFLIGL